MNRVHISLWANKRRIKKDGRVGLYLQIVIERKHALHKLNIDWPAKLFDWKEGRLLSRSKKDKEYDDCLIIIERERAKMWEVVRTYRIAEREISLSSFFGELNSGESRQSFVHYMETAIEQRYRLGKIDTITRNGQFTTLNSLKQYNGHVRFMEVDHKFLEHYTGWLKKNGLADGTLWGRVKHIRVYLNRAREDGIPINHRHALFKNPKPPGRIVFLEKYEIHKLIDLRFHPLMNVYRRNVLDAFLFACFTGLRISDWRRVNNWWINADGEMYFLPHKGRKTGRYISVPLLPVARQFITNPNGFFFDLPADPQINIRLKEIAELAGIKKKMTAHVARHTCGTQMAAAGIPVQVISEVLGHSKVATTMIYVHLTDRMKNREMQKLQSAFS
ncbi:MAG: site-specific integrase [Mucilaginibacter polytrichastri]|nr:site-specific integrase [Mucilaginibacter polytrichastri]